MYVCHQEHSINVKIIYICNWPLISVWSLFEYSVIFFLSFTLSYIRVKKDWTLVFELTIFYSSADLSIRKISFEHNMQKIYEWRLQADNNISKSNKNPMLIGHCSQVTNTWPICWDSRLIRLRKCHYGEAMITYFILSTDENNELILPSHERLRNFITRIRQILCDLFYTIR